MWGEGETTTWDIDTQNTVLNKAIQLFIHHKLNLNILSAVVDWTSTEDKAASIEFQSEGNCGESYKTL
jgi:hypothetical protein